ncbi:capsule assembly Wzi family protein [Anaeromyxobacter paludicola]|uniref:Capsule assembly Wzi family protein n=1 Tax=Anaeromyxobacter paludicola TaxID=2918171 RepID=A0ABN6NBZ9_9BACT|nr:capsule assembly Wzi family protein [Anaeromyxobacter paludicola]BDG09644.1 hypothetical protein AMPC_27570 [Anaeromyxobacter paludicola]
MHSALALLIAASTAITEAPPASPLLPPEHWAVQAAARLHDLGLAPEWLPAQRAAPILVVERALTQAAAAAGREGSAAAPLARAWLERFRAEFPGSASAAADAFVPRLMGASVGAGYEGGGTHPAAAPASSAPAALRLGAPGSAAVLDTSAAASWGPHLAIGLQGRATAWDAELRGGELVLAVGPVALSAGREPVGYGPGAFGAVVASGRAAVDRLELMTTTPVRLPGLLGGLGELALDTALARFSEARHPYHPLLWEFQLQWRPHPRLTLSAIRGVMFGGALWEGIDAHDVPLAILGIKNYRENNVYSGAIRYRLPTEALLPLTARLEWGSDDNPGAAVTWPGLVVGLSAPMVPGILAELGIEYAYFGRGPSGYHDPFAWYSHGQYAGGWATGETPLGDPLGGNGRALRLTGAADPFDGRARIAGALWVQDRFRDNLYAPAAAGRSVGGQLEAEWRFGRAAVGARASYERGEAGWYRRELGAEGRVFF